LHILQGLLTKDKTFEISYSFQQLARVIDGIVTERDHFLVRPHDAGVKPLGLRVQLFHVASNTIVLLLNLFDSRSVSLVVRPLLVFGVTLCVLLLK
jgi:hypothetical protein